MMLYFGFYIPEYVDYLLTLPIINYQYSAHFSYESIAKAITEGVY